MAGIETFTFGDPSLARDGVHVFSVDWRDGVIRSEARGFWSPALAQAQMTKWRECVAALHASGMAVRALVDLRGQGTQSPEVAGAIERGVEGMYRAGDRVAIIVASSLVKMQMRRSTTANHVQLFTSPEAAETWMMAYAL